MTAETLRILLRYFECSEKSYHFVIARLRKKSWQSIMNAVLKVCNGILTAGAADFALIEPLNGFGVVVV